MSEAIDELETYLEHQQFLLTRTYTSIANTRVAACVEVSSQAA